MTKHQRESLEALLINARYDYFLSHRKVLEEVLWEYVCYETEGLDDDSLMDMAEKMGIEVIH